MPRNRFDSRSYRPLDKHDFDSLFKDFKKLLHELISEAEDGHYPMKKLHCILRFSEDIINVSLWRGRERLFQNFTWFYGIDGIDVYPYLYDLRKQLNTKPYMTREETAVLEYEGEDMLILEDRKTRKLFEQALLQAFSG